jgi:polyisoprenoid-binding protein YceI
VRKFLIIIPFIIAVPLLAQNPPKEAPGKRDAKRVTAGTYLVEPTHTLVGWTVTHFGFNDYFGIIGSPTGTMTLDPAKLNAATLAIDIPIGEFTTANAKLTEHMKSPDFFDFAKFPTAKFVSTKVVAKGETALIQGNLTIKGVTKPVTLNAKFTGAGFNAYSKKESVGFSATTSIKRSDWGMGYGIPLVSDNVDLRITVAFEKTG